MHLWHGPYRIVELTSPVNVKLQTMNSKKMKQIVHVSRLRKYVTPMRPSEEPVLQESDDFDWEKEMEQLKDNQLQQTSKQPTSQHSSQMDDEMMESEKEFEVQKILDIRKVEGGVQYLVRWKGYSASEDSWEPAENLNCNQLIDMYHQNTKTLCNKCGFRGFTAHGLATHTKRHK